MPLDNISVGGKASPYAMNPLETDDMFNADVRPDVGIEMPYKNDGKITSAATSGVRV